MRRRGKLYELNDNEICAERSQIGMVSQRFNLFQHLTVLDNVTIGQTKVRGINADAARSKARELTPGKSRRLNSNGKIVKSDVTESLSKPPVALQDRDGDDS
jgi:ABC-type arginine transport system ATPase subunit